MLGASGGPLGRNYMGHLDGTIADLVLDDPAKAAAFDFVHADGGYVRRRFTFPAEVQTRERLFNIALWLRIHRATTQPTRTALSPLSGSP